MAEMKVLVDKTGGFSIIQEQFKQQVFQDSIRKYFDMDEEGNLIVTSGASIELIPSKPMKIKGCIGSCHSHKTKTDNCSKEVVGEGETDKWYVGGLDHNFSLTFIMEVDNNNTKDPKQLAYIQLLTQYKHPCGNIRLRVTTISRSYVHTFQQSQIIQGMDQQAIIATFAKLAANKSQELDSSVVIRWLDRNLIFLMAKFAKYQKGANAEESFSMPDEISIIPQFFYYLRKSWFVRTFASSLDESVYYRLVVSRDNVSNVLTMIQPCITQYDLESEQPSPVICDIESMQDSVILLMDCYFFVGIWYGSNIKNWVDNNYHEQEEYAHLKNLLELPEEDAKVICNDRINVPKIVHTFPGHGLERIFKSRLNPSGEARNETFEGGHFITDDKSLRVFMEHLIKAVVTQS